jgi:hypothetical protein
MWFSAGTEAYACAVQAEVLPVLAAAHFLQDMTPEVGGVLAEGLLPIEVTANGG